MNWINDYQKLSVMTNIDLLSRQLDVLMEHLSDAVDIVDLNGTIMTVNCSFERMYGWNKKELIGKALPIIPTELLSEFKMLQNMILKGHKIIGYETARIRKDGSLIQIILTISPLIDDKGEAYGYVCISRDITDPKQKIQYLTSYDQLTNLPNRNKFYEIALHTLETSKNTKNKMAVVILNLDQFTMINNIFGHVDGDHLLKEIANRLISLIGPRHVIARLGSDEFVLLFEHITHSREVISLIRSVFKVFHSPFKGMKENEVTITSSIGVSVYPRDGRDLESLIQRAYTAMNCVKNSGGNMFSVYQKRLEKTSNEHYLLGQDLRKSFERQELDVYYQPMAEVSTGRIVGLEALLRWKHAQKGFIPPSVFIPIAEEVGIIDMLGLWVLRKACEALNEMHSKGLGSLKVAVNLSALQLQNKNLPRQIQKILRETQCDGKWIELEITESAIIKNIEITRKILKEIKALGIQISLDDFGTGYSSLDYLKRFPIDNMKIDKSFIQSKLEEDLAIVKGIFTIAQLLHLRVIGEGVETLEHLEFLRRNNCDLYQGYLTTKPLPLDQIFKFMKERENNMNL